MPDDTRLRRRIHRLNLKAAERKIDWQAAEIKRLQAALGNFLEYNQTWSDNENEDAFSDNSNGFVGEDDEDDECDSDSDLALRSPLWDDEDGVYRCKECHFEVEEAFCTGCNAEHHSPIDDSRLKDTISVISEATSYDRCLPPRGTTPVREIEDVHVPAIYKNRRTEFFELLGRGATVLMCETFQLEYSASTGIVAWADSDIFEMFSGPAMLQGESWKIYLGRCIKLDTDDDDGSQFLEGILEDVLLFPVESAIEWRTSRESPSIWATGREVYYHGFDDTPSEDEDYDAIFYQNNGANIPGNIHGRSNLHVLYDASLGYPCRETNEDSVIYANNYETETQDSCELDEDADTEMECDSGWAIDAHKPDAVYTGPGTEGEGEKEEEGEEGEEGDDGEQVAEMGVRGEEGGDNMSVTQSSGEANPAEDDERSQLSDDSDMAGSGFDSDEVLSGDEGLGWLDE